MFPGRKIVVTGLAMVWTIVCAAVAMISHSLTLGYGDVSMWVARNLWARPVLWVMGVKLEIEGRDRYTPNQPWVVAANHQGVLDIPIIFLAFPDLRIRFIAKQELFYIPIFGWYLWLAGHIAVSRNSRRKAIRSIDAAGERIKRHRSTIIVFPEGTRSEDGHVAQFKKGAFVLALNAQVPVLPVVIAGSFGAINKTRWHIEPGTIWVRILEPIPTEDLSYKDRNRLVEMTKETIDAGVVQLRAEKDLGAELAIMETVGDEKVQPDGLPRAD